MRKITFILVSIAVAGILGVAGLLLNLYIYSRTPFEAQATSQLFTVTTGQAFYEVVNRLIQSNIVQQPLKFKILARLKGFDGRIKAGEYELSAAMSPEQILQTMTRGKVRLYKITIPEGYNLWQIAAALEAAGLCTSQEFINTATNPDLVTSMGIKADRLEGYLFPETYHFPKNMAPEKIADAMVARFWEIMTPLWQDRAAKIGLSVHEVVTLASIIEKETGAAAERPLISSVFHNRLKRKMRLETDPTVIYGLQEFDGNLTRKHLQTKTPYNTYKIRGLPPGPIASPGKKALEAALYPADTKFLYFVSKKDTTHQFSTNLKDHNRAVRRYQLRRK